MITLTHLWASLVAQMVKKNLAAMQETQVRSLGWEDPLEEELANHSCILAWRIPWTEEPGQLQYYICKSQLIYIYIYFFFLMFGTFHECTCQQYEEQVVECKKHMVNENVL